MFLSAWALIPSALLAGVLTLLAGLVAMAADDFDRPMEMGERLIVVLPVLALIWFGSIIARLLFSAYRRHKLEASGPESTQATTASRDGPQSPARRP